MLKILLEAETADDSFNPLTIANAITEMYTRNVGPGKDMDASVDNLEAVADHILIGVRAYRQRMRREERYANIGRREE